MLLSVLVSGVPVLIHIITGIKYGELGITLNLILVCHSLHTIIRYKYQLLMYEDDQLCSRKRVSIFSMHAAPDTADTVISDIMWHILQSIHVG